MENMSQENHAMVCERMLDNGVDVLYCPACGRKILIQWTPIVRQVILEPGDETAVHTAYRVPRDPDVQPSMGTAVEADSAASGSAHNHAVPAMPELTQADEVRLAEWETLLQEVGFESWWTRPVE